MKRNDYSNKRELVKAQILAIRDSGQTNMYASRAVQRLAYERDFFELVCFIEEQPNQYAKFIISGDENLLPE